MKLATYLSILATLSITNAAYVPSQPFSTLTPSEAIPTSASALANFDGSFALSIRTLEGYSSASSTATPTAAVKDVSKEESGKKEKAAKNEGKEAANQISDGQVQQQTKSTAASVVNQITDGQPQQQTKTTAASVVNQITDGQPQQQTKATAASVVNQITDGQIQQQPKATAASVVNQITDGQIQQQPAKPTAASVVNQITDGQIQQQPAKPTAASVVNQITDGQIQQQPAKSSASVVNQITDGQIQQQPAKSSASVVNQITDGQPQQQTVKPTAASVVSQITDGQPQANTAKPTATVASQITDGQVQGTKTQSAASGAATHLADGPTDSIAETCVGPDALTLTLKDGILRDSKGRIGAIVANRQFQFDGPPPQAGSIYAAGWSLVPSSYKEDSSTKIAGDTGNKTKRADEGYKLALGKQTTFYKCLSGDFYNLYDESIGGQCSPIEIDILKAVSC